MSEQSLPLKVGNPKKYSDEELVAFERTWGICLPEPYREYLKTVGAGCWTNSAVDLLDDWSYNSESLPADYLQKNFPHSHSWNDRSLLTVAGWKSPYFSNSLVCGSIRIRSTGCEGHDILVLAGVHRGEVWHDDRACNGTGIFPVLDQSLRRVSIQQYLNLGSNSLGLVRMFQLAEVDQPRV